MRPVTKGTFKLLANLGIYEAVLCDFIPTVMVLESLKMLLSYNKGRWDGRMKDKYKDVL